MISTMAKNKMVTLHCNPYSLIPIFTLSLQVSIKMPLQRSPDLISLVVTVVDRGQENYSLVMLIGMVPQKSLLRIKLQEMP